MTNFEFYKDDILKIILGNGYPGLVKETGKLTRCKLLECKDCVFITDNERCFVKLFKWLYEEHIDKPKLTKQEKAFLELTDPNYYIARDEDGLICMYTSKPQKDGGAWGNIEYTSLSLFSVKFNFIKWEDEEPWKVEELLKLGVME